MSSNFARYGIFSILIHWLLALAAFALLGLGWYSRFWPAATPDEQAFLADLHISLGITTAALLIIAVIARLLSGSKAHSEESPRWRRLTSAALNALVYLALAVVAASGYLRLVFSGTPVLLWGTPLPAWGEPDDSLAELFTRTHEFAAYGLAGLLVLHIGFVIANSVAHAKFAKETPLGGGPGGTDSAPVLRMSGPVGGASAAKAARDIARMMRILGWLGFWIQFVFAFLSALLLQFATSGRALSAVTLGFGDAIYWSGVALALLLVTCALAFLYTRQAKKLEQAPERYLARKTNSSFWFLRAGTGLSVVGVLLSFIGVALSISLLIAKTVSQPPGIAITDPSKIVRALDIFVLLMSFLLLLAHFIGMAIGAWLQNAAAKARVRYLVASRMAAESLSSPGSSI